MASGPPGMLAAHPEFPMTPDFDAIIIGSGPAGVSAAFPLVDAGLRVLMVDGGQQTDAAPPSRPFLTERAENGNQWKWIAGEDFHALKMRESVSPKLRVPAYAPVFEDFENRNRIATHDFIAVGSLAPGGLSNAWGCGVARLSPTELSEFPFPASDLERSYENVARRIGISGREDDDLSGYFGLDDWAQPPVEMDRLHRRMLERYASRRENLLSSGFRLGRSRVAALTRDHAGRKACDNSGNCLWGCHRRALYCSADELPALQRHANFRYERGLIVEAVERQEERWSVSGSRANSGEHWTVTSRKVILAAGTLATTRLALASLKNTRATPLLSCPTAAFLLWLPSQLGAPRKNAFGLGQLSFALQLEENLSGFGSTFGTTGIPVTEFVRHLPLGRRYGVDLLRGLLSSCLVGNIFLPGRLSSAKTFLEDDGSLRIEGGHADNVPQLMQTAEKRLRKAYWRLGALLLPMSFTVGRPGGDIHYAGTLPMRKIPRPGESNANGELYGAEGLHIVDGACLSSLSEKSHTLTIMANADRIGRIVATSHRA